MNAEQIYDEISRRNVEWMKEHGPTANGPQLQEAGRRIFIEVMSKYLAQPAPIPPDAQPPTQQARQVECRTCSGTGIVNQYVPTGRERGANDFENWPGPCPDCSQQQATDGEIDELLEIMAILLDYAPAQNRDQYKKAHARLAALAKSRKPEPDAEIEELRAALQLCVSVFSPSDARFCACTSAGRCLAHATITKALAALAKSRKECGQ